MLHYLPGNLKKYRILKNLTQENVAEYLRITPQSVSKWERGVHLDKDTTSQTHAYTTSRTANFVGGISYEKTDFR